MAIGCSRLGGLLDDQPAGAAPRSDISGLVPYSRRWRFLEDHGLAAPPGQWELASAWVRTQWGAALGLLVLPARCHTDAPGPPGVTIDAATKARIRKRSRA